MSSVKNFKFKKGMSIGAMDASEDDRFLESCFIDTGDISALEDTESSKSIILGRTGSGKTALLSIIRKNNDNVINLLPQELSLNYIADSNIIQFFDSTGVKLDLFYQLLWKHVLVVELIKRKYDIRNETSKKNFLDSLAGVFKKDTSKQRAIEYLTQWGDKFWVETSSRIEDLTTKLEHELSASIDLNSIQVPLTASGSSKLSSEMREEVTNQAQKIVNKVQIQDLNRVIDILSDNIFTNKQQKYYIVIDQLDDEWVDDNIRYRLIRSLIETIKGFRKIIPVKIIIALRSDLLYRVFDKTRDSGFQEEKYEDYILKLMWRKDELRSLLDKRIDLSIREAYTSKSASFSQIFTGTPDGEKPIDFILDRTLMRPRDAISFTNECFNSAYGKTNITSQILKEAEKNYSKKRFKALCFEWVDDYPLLEDYCRIIPGPHGSFKHSSISNSSIEKLALDLSIKEAKDPIKDLALGLVQHNSLTKVAFRNHILRVLYRVGIIGIKRNAYTSVEWSHEDDVNISSSEIKNSQSFEVHKMLWRYLGIYKHSKGRPKHR